MPAVVALTDSFVPSLPKGWNASVRIKLADGTTDATVYKDANGVATGSNPLPNGGSSYGVDGSGGWLVYVVPGDYVVSVTPHGGSEHHASVTVAADVYSPPAQDDLLPAPAGEDDAGKVPTVNDAGTGYELAAPSGGGGGASEQSNGYYDSGNGGDGFTVPHTGPALAPWAASSGTELLDLTDPTQPTVVSDGLYAVTANVSADSTPTKDSALTLTLNTAGGLGTQIADVIGPVGGLGGGSATAFLAAGSAITVSVRNKESTDQTYYLSATVCKIA